MNILIICITIIICVFFICHFIYEYTTNKKQNNYWIDIMDKDIETIHNIMTTINIKEMYDSELKAKLHTIKTITSYYNDYEESDKETDSSKD